jgi:hypothetical protein
MKSFLKPLLLAVTAVMLGGALAGPALALTDAEIRKLPGYVDFDALKLFKGQEAKIEIYLKDPMLELVSKFVKSEDPELFEVLANLKLVRVQVYDVDRAMAQQVSEVSSTTAKELDAKGWERIVRVRDDEEHVDVYLKPSKDYEWLDGLVVMVVDSDDEAVFVNIVGKIHPDDISKLGQHFDIDELDIDSSDVHIRND